LRCPLSGRLLARVGLWRSWERASMAWKRSPVRSRPGPPNLSTSYTVRAQHTPVSEAEAGVPSPQELPGSGRMRVPLAIRRLSLRSPQQVFHALLRQHPIQKQGKYGCSQRSKSVHYLPPRSCRHCRRDTPAPPGLCSWFAPSIRQQRTGQVPRSGRSMKWAHQW
jgi:hypothetical protein